MTRSRAAQCVAAVFLFSAALSATAAEADQFTRVVVVKVRMLVGDLRYDWSDPASVPLRSEGGFTSPSTIASFLGIAPGDSMSAEELERRRAFAEDRLKDSGYFYSVRVQVVPAQSAPAGRLVITRVSEGFLWRFGGGPWFATVGRDNVFGGRKSWRVAAGYNKIGAAWEDDAVAGRPFFYGVSVFYSRPLDTELFASERVEVGLRAGVRADPDLSFFLQSLVVSPFPDPIGGLEWLPGMGFHFERRLYSSVLRFSFETENRMEISVGRIGVSWANAEGWTSFHLSPLSSGPGLAVRVCYGAVQPCTTGALPAAALFDLGGDPSRAVRSGYDPVELFVSDYALANIELRFPFPAIHLGPIVAVVVAPFLFADAALADRSPLSDFADFEAFGLGARIVFDNPIFASFSFSYGWNPAGAGRFAFTTTWAF